MDEREIAAIQKPILEAIENLHTPLAAIALLKMADEFYSKLERAVLYAELETLYDADAAARQDVAAALPPDELSWKKRVEQFGEAIAKEQFGPYEIAMEAKVAAGRRVSEFEKKHRLLVRLRATMELLGKGRYE